MYSIVILKEKNKNCGTFELNASPSENLGHNVAPTSHESSAFYVDVNGGCFYASDVLAACTCYFAGLHVTVRLSALEL